MPRGLPLRQRMRRSRVLGWDRNPMRRRIDRIEAGLLAGLFALFLIGAPVLAGVAGRGIRAAGLRQQRAEASWRPAWAIVQGGVAPPPDVPRAAGVVGTLARWMAPDGRPRSGWIVVGAAAAAGGRSRVWVNRRGALTGPPLRRAQLRERVSTARVLTACGAGVLLAFVAVAGRYLLRQCRLTGWEREWREVEPRWTKSRY